MLDPISCRHLHPNPSSPRPNSTDTDIITNTNNRQHAITSSRRCHSSSASQCNNNLRQTSQRVTHDREDINTNAFTGGPHWHRKCTVNMKQPERMAKEICQQILEKEEKRRAEVVAKEIEEMRQCTFQPKVPEYHPSSSSSFNISSYLSDQDSSRDDIGSGNSGGGNNTTTSRGNSFSSSCSSSVYAPVVVRGLGRHLELKQMSQKQKEDNARREDEAFTVKNADKYRRPSDGSTIVKPFNFHLSDTTIQSRPSRAVLELEAKEEANLTFSPSLVSVVSTASSVVASKKDRNNIISFHR